MKAKQYICFLIIFLLATTVCLAQADNSFRVEIVNGHNLTVSVERVVGDQIYESDQFINSINYSLTNESEMYIGRVAFIQFVLNEKNEELSTNFWSVRDGLKSFETKRFSTPFGLLISESTKLVWVVHTICTNKGTWQIKFSDVRKAGFPYSAGKNITLPKAEFSQDKCFPD
jgi:hypothetical protein